MKMQQADRQTNLLQLFLEQLYFGGNPPQVECAAPIRSFFRKFGDTGDRRFELCNFRLKRAHSLQRLVCVIIQPFKSFIVG
jgi:hypothetical protein